MGLFSKKRHGTLSAADSAGRRFLWRLSHFSAHKTGTTLDSANVSSFSACKFHLHLELGESGDVGLYVHYKSGPIPKYSYYFMNSARQVMRQHTAHTIPSDTARCGHWNAVSHRDILRFIARDDELWLTFVFDDDCVAVRHEPQRNIIAVRWDVPRLFQQMLNPFSSGGFLIDRALLVGRIDVKKYEGASGASGEFTVDNIKELVLFVFCRKGNVPPHSIELMDEENNVIAKLEGNNESGSQPFVVPKEQLLDAIGMHGALRIGFEFSSGGNPLNALNSLSNAHQQQQQQQQQQQEKMKQERQKQRGEAVEKRERYVTMSGDD